MAASRRALFSILAVASMLVSAAGIGYMASVSYPDELGIVDARAKEQHRKAEQLAARLAEALGERLDGLREGLGKEDRVAAAGKLPLSERFFLVDEEAELRYPLKAPLGQVEDTGATIVPPLRGYRERSGNLQKALSLESQCVQSDERCSLAEGDLARARALYESALGYDDTGAEALLGLARLHRQQGELALASSRYRELADRFRKHTDEAGVPYELLAELGIAECSGSAPAYLRLLQHLLGRRFSAPEGLLDVVAQSVLEDLRAMDLRPEEALELDRLEGELQRARADAFLAGLLGDKVGELSAMASSELRGIEASWQRGLTLVMEQGEDEWTVGILVEQTQLQSMLRAASEAMGLHESLDARLLRKDRSHEVPDIRAQVALGSLLPHLELAIIESGGAPSAMVEIEKARSRHRAITGGLIGILVLGLFATIRGAARERELARLKSDFVSTVSHELKTPLTSIRMFAEMLQQGVAGEDRQREARYHEIIVKESERLGLLIANLLDYAQIEKGTRQYSSEQEVGEALLREAAESFERLREGEGHALRVQVAEEAKGLSVRADREVVVQCLLNLLSNAAKYGGEEEIQLRLSLASRDHERRLLFEVEDEGPGIPESEQEKIFKEFYRAPEAVKSAIEGTGLGLALVKRHVESLGGDINVTSAPGEGATFGLELPVVES